MKIRNGFVSNSSSSSFLVTCLPWLCFNKRRKRLITKEQEKKLLRYGFKITESTNPLHIENNVDSLKKTVIKKKYGYGYGFNVSCNQQDVIDFLTKNRIPFEAVTNYCNETVIYNGGDTYFTILNIGNMINVYGKSDPKKELADILLNRSIISEDCVKDIKDSFDRKIKRAKRIKNEN